MKHKKLTYDEFIRDIINMELMLKHVCYDDLDEQPVFGEFDGVPFYQYFSFDTKREHEAWREYVYKRISDCNSLRHYTKKLKIQLVCYLDLVYGFRINY
jgi:hypothetical protein